MIEIVYPIIIQGENNDNDSNGSNFQNLKIAGDFNGWSIEPMKRELRGDNTVWCYEVNESQLVNCKNFNDKGQRLIHFKFIDDSQNWFIVNDYDSESDEHNNVNNVKAVTIEDKPTEVEKENIVVDEGPETPVPSLKETSVEPTVEEPESTPDSSAQDEDKSIIIEEEHESEIETNTEPNENETADVLGKVSENNHIDIPDEIIEGTPGIDTKLEDDEVMVEEVPDQTPDTSNLIEETEIKEEIPTEPEAEEQDSLVSNLKGVLFNPTEHQGNHVESGDEEFFSPRKFEEPHEEQEVPVSSNMLDSPVAPVVVTAAEIQGETATVDIENNDLTVDNKNNTEEYENVLRRLLNGFCSWFQWLFGVFSSKG